MNSITARELYQQRLDALGPEGKDEAIRGIHDALARAQREKIEFVYAEYRRQHGKVPVILVVDVLYDEFGEELGVTTHGADLISELQQKAFYGNGYAPMIFAFSPQDAHDLIARRFSAEDAATALHPPVPGKVKLYIASMGALSGYDAIAAPG